MGIVEFLQKYELLISIDIEKQVRTLLFNKTEEEQLKLLTEFYSVTNYKFQMHSSVRGIYIRLFNKQPLKD